VTGLNAVKPNIQVSNSRIQIPNLRVNPPWNLRSGINQSTLNNEKLPKSAVLYFDVLERLRHGNSSMLYSKIELEFISLSFSLDGKVPT